MSLEREKKSKELEMKIDSERGMSFFPAKYSSLPKKDNSRKRSAG